MNVKNEFSKHANDYNSYNIIQQIVAKALVREMKSKSKKILELGCGSGQVYNYIDWEITQYDAVDFSRQMCDLHPRGKNLNIHCMSFDSEEFFEFTKNKEYDMVLSSSALQWSQNLSKITQALSKITKEINAVLFTSNTFKTIQEITNKTSPILSSSEIQEAFDKYFETTFETINYNLKFDSKKQLFDYIKNSGVSGNSNELSFKEAKNLYKNYALDYLEFEVMFVKAFSKSYSS